MICSLALSLTALAVPPQFSQPVDLTRGLPSASALRFGDFDGDGVVDVIGASSTSGKIRLWRGDGAGGYGAGEAVSANLFSIVNMSVGDLDGDGDLDLSVATPGPSVEWVENLGGGDFAGPIPLAGFGAVLPGSIVRQRIVDFDRNGTNDVLMTFDRSSSGQTSLVLLASSLGGGQFTSQTLIASTMALYDAEAADLDGDGDNDIVVGGLDVGAWFRNDGAGALSTPIPLPLFSGATDEQVAAADVDGDGFLDLLSLQCFDPFPGTVVYVSAGDGAGGFSQQMTARLRTCTPSFDLEDVNGDGRLDLVAANMAVGAGSQVELALGSISGAFEPALSLLDASRSFTAVSIGDSDGDGVWELVSGTEAGLVTLREFVPSAVPPALADDFVELTETLSFASRDRLVDTADFNGDGLTDLCVVGRDERKVAWWPADGSGGFDPLRTIERFEVVPRDLYVAEIDGDSFEDVIYRSSITGVYMVHRGDGMGGFADAASLNFQAFPFGVSGFSDVDGDGRDDLVSAFSGQLSRPRWARSLGGGAFGPPATVSMMPESIAAPRFQDVNGDGLIDLAFLRLDSGGAPARFGFYGATAPGVFAATTTELDLFTPFPFEDVSTWRVGDMNGDGELDLVVSATAGQPVFRNRLMIYRGLGADQFGPVSVVAGSPQAGLGLEVFDIDGDGRLDLLNRLTPLSGQEDGLVWYRNLNGVQFAPGESLVPASTITGEFLVGDFDGDGDGDAVVAETQVDAVLLVRSLYRGEIGLPFCAASVPNSTGEIGKISAFGSALPGAGDLTLTVRDLPLQSFGLFLASQVAGSAAVMNSVGVLCLDGPVGRFTGPGQIVSSGAAGTISISAMPAALPTPQGPTAALAGQTWHFQAWHRDVANGQATSNFTRAVSVLFL